MRPRARLIEGASAEELFQADLDWWQEASSAQRVAAVDAARDDLLRMGRTMSTRRGRENVNSDFETFLELLNQQGAEYLIVGGYAVAFHAAPRFTKAIDILIRPERANAERVLAAITDFIGEPDFTAERLARPDVVLMMGLPPSRIDVLTSIQGVEFEGAWSRRVEGAYGGQRAWFIGLQDLLDAKQAAGREQDLRDLRRLRKVAHGGSE